MADRLADLQSRFFDAIAGSQGETGGDPHLAEWIEGDAAQRAGVYKTAYFVRLHDVLFDDFPKIVGWIGLDEFHALAAEYLARFPSESPSLRHLGARFPAFLADHALNERFPHLAELAALEWARIEVFDERDVMTLQATDLALLPADKWAVVRFPLIPAFRCVTLHEEILDVWLALHDGKPLVRADHASAPRIVLVWRRDFVVYHRAAFSAAEAAAVARLQEGAPFASVCECFLDGAETEDAVAARAFGALAQWIADGQLMALKT